MSKIFKGVKGKKTDIIPFDVEIRDASKQILEKALRFVGEGVIWRRDDLIEEDIAARQALFTAVVMYRRLLRAGPTPTRKESK